MKKIIVLLAFSLVYFVRAEVELEISQGHYEPMQVGLPKVNFDIKSLEIPAFKIQNVIRENLKRTGFFKFTDPSIFLEKAVPIREAPRFLDWRLIETQLVVNLSLTKNASQEYQLTCRVWDTLTEKLLLNVTLATEPQYWRRLAHLVSDHIYKRLTGENGYFDTRIVYIEEKKEGKQLKKRLAIMDQDGENRKILTNGDVLVLTPRFSPNLQKITYLSYENKVPKVYVHDLETGQHTLVGSFPGMTFAPRFSPDGRRVILSQAERGRSDIYVMDLKERRFKKLTRGGWIDTSPCYDPTGRKVVFNSDRSGLRQLYTMAADGSGVKRISFGGGAYSTPVWSPRGDYIVFTKAYKGQFYIGIMRPDGSDEKLLTQGYVVDNPSWAPNGRTIIFAKTHKDPKKAFSKTHIYAVDITGQNERRIQTGAQASDPTWSPLLPTVK